MLLTNNHGFKVYLEQISELVTKFNYTLSLETNFTSRTSLFPLLPGKMTVISNFSLGWQLSVTYSTWPCMVVFFGTPFVTWFVCFLGVYVLFYWWIVICDSLLVTSRNFLRNVWLQFVILPHFRQGLIVDFILMHLVHTFGCIWSLDARDGHFILLKQQVRANQKPVFSQVKQY